MNLSHNGLVSCLIFLINLVARSSNGEDLDEQYNRSHSKDVDTRESVDQCRFGYFCKFRDSCGRTPYNRGARPFLVNAMDVDPGEFPSLAQVVVYDRHLICGGVIVSDYHIATEITCIMKDKKMTDLRKVGVFVGTRTNVAFLYSKGPKPDASQILRINKICIHPSVPLSSNAVLLRLEKKLQFSDMVQPACWPTNATQVDIKSPNALCYIVGGGLSSRRSADKLTPANPILQKFRVRHRPPCGRVIPPTFDCWKSFQRIASACIYDWGSPILCYNQETRRWTLMGVLFDTELRISQNLCPAHGRLGTSWPDRDLALKTSGECRVPSMDSFFDR